MKKKVISWMLLTLMLALPHTRAFFSAEAAETNVVRFGLFSDTHADTEAITEVFNSFYALTDNGADLDCVIMNGDISYVDTVNQASNYDALLSNEKYQELNAQGKIIYQMGNHEFVHNSAGNEELTAEAVQVFEETTGFKADYHTVHSGYHFVVTGTTDYGGVMKSKEEWMKQELSEALSDGTQKPVFLVVHHPVPKTISGSTARYSAEFKNFLDSNPRIIALHGHNHTPMSDPRTIYQNPGGCTHIITSKVERARPGGDSYATEAWNKDYSQAAMMEINPDTNVVTFKRFYVDNENPTYFESEDWVLDIPTMIMASESADTSDDVIAYKYTDEREKLSVAPHFEDENGVLITEIKEDSATVNISEATAGAEGDDSAVKYYEINVYEGDSAQHFKRIVKLSDICLMPGSRRTTYSQLISDLSPDTEYRVEVCATTTWYKKSEIISVKFKTAEEAFPEAVLDADYTYTVAAADMSNDSGSTYHRGTYIQIPNTASSHTFTATFEVTNPGMYRFMASSIRSNGAPTTMVISKVENGEKTALTTAEIYISTANVLTYDVPYADLALKEGTYTATWSRGDTGSLVTLNGLKVGRYAPLPIEYWDEYVVSKTAADYLETSETVEEGQTPESFTLNKDGYVTWQFTPEYTATYELSYDLLGEGATTVASLGATASGEQISALPENAEITADGKIELQLFTHTTYNFTFKATADGTQVNGMSLRYKELFADLENKIYKFTYNVGTDGTYKDLSYGNIDGAVKSVPAYVEKTITVPFAANYTFSINAGLAGDRTLHAYIGRASGGSVKIAKTGAIDTIENRVIFENVSLEAGESYKVTIINGTGSSTLRVQDIVFETSGEYLPDSDNLTFLTSDYTTKNYNTASVTAKHCGALIGGKNATFKLKPGAGTYKVYAYCKQYKPHDNLTVNMYVDGLKISSYGDAFSSSVEKCELGTITVSDNEFMLKIDVPKITDKTQVQITAGVYFYRFELEAIDEPLVTMHAGETADSSNITTALTAGDLTAKAYLPKDADGKNITMMLAVYADNALFTMNTYSFNGKKNSVVTVALDDLYFLDGKTYASKVFFWDSTEGMVPLYDNPEGGNLANVAVTEITE